MTYKLSFHFAGPGWADLASVIQALRWKNRALPVLLSIECTFGSCINKHNIATSSSEPQLALHFVLFTKIKAPLWFIFLDILKRIMFDHSSPQLYLHVLCVMIQRESIGHCILKIRIGILLLGNLVTPINLCLTNSLKI